MAIETILGFRNVDSTENLNARLAGLVPKGIVKGGIVVPEPASLQVRVKGNPEDGVVFLAFGKDGMMVRERAEERVLPIVAGLTNVIALRCKYLESQPPLVSLEVMTLGAYNNDPEKDTLIRFASVTPPANATAVLPEHINSSFRDSVEGFKRGVVRGVVDTKVDLPATSGFPATAEINLTSNTFAEGSSISLSTGATSLTFPLVSPISFPVASPSVPGLSRVNPSQKTILTAVQDSVGVVTVTTSEPHGFANQTIRISDNTAAQANSLWTIEEYTEYTFSFQAPLTTPWSGVGGSVVDTFSPATVTATIAPGNTHTFIPGQQFIITGATEQTFNGLFTVQTVVNAQKILFQQIGYPSRDSGNGKLTKVGYSLPPNAVEIGESGDITAKNFEQALRASELDGDMKVFAMGSSLQLEARVSGSFGNTFIISKEEPGATVPSIVVSNFSGGIDPNAASAQASAESLQKGDLYVVLFGELGTIELWGFDGSVFRNMTSASAATLLDFHRRNLFVNEKHLSENEKAALVGTVGVPSAVNRYVTEQDVSVLTETTAAALQGADSVPPGQTNRYLTEARIRGQRGSIHVPDGTNYVELPLGETWVVGVPPQLTFDASAVDVSNSKFIATNHGFLEKTKVIFTTTGGLPGGLSISVYYYVVQATLDSFKISASQGGSPLTITSGGTGSIFVCDDTYAKQFFNLIHTETLFESGGCTEYSQEDFTPVIVEGVYVDEALSTVLNPYDHCALNGTFPRPDAITLSKPLQLYVKLSAIPNNGSATVLYSQAVIERSRLPQSDMLMGPQRIIPAELQDVINRTKELRFHAGIAASGTTVTFPANLFRSENLQGFKYRRFVGNRPVDLTSTFSINFATGTGTTNVVTAFTPVSYTGQAGKWTRYALFLTTTDKIRVQHVESLLEATSDLSFASTLDAVAVPSLAMTDGSHLFATVGIKVNSTASGIESIEPEHLEFYPYHTGRDPGAVIVCGDGASSYGHFTGSTAHTRALSYASSGDTIRILPGTYTGNFVVSKDDITLDCTPGAILQNTGSTILTVVADRFQAIAPRFRNCSIAVNVQPGSDNFRLSKAVFESTVTTKFQSPSRVTFSTTSFLDSIITSAGHGLLAGARVKLTSTGALPSGLSTTTTYYIASVTTNSFRLATSKSGSGLVSFTNATGSGTHTVWAGQSVDPQIEETAVAKWVVTDGSNTNWLGDFNSPNALQQAQDAASEGDVILAYPGTYNRVVWTKSYLVLQGFGGGKVKINGGGTNFTGLTVSGSYNQIDNLLIDNAGTGIVCSTGAVHNTFGINVQFGNDVRTAIKFPITAATKHYNYHPMLCGRVTTGNSFESDNPMVTVGDGVVSWGDYVGENAINVALQEENEGTIIQVFRGQYLAIKCQSSGKSVVGAPGQQTVIRANALLDTICVDVDGNRNTFKNLFVQADNNDNEAIGLTTVGIKVNGSDNHFENIDFPETGSERIESHLKYKVVSGARNRFLPHTGAPAGEISWTVGDGVRSFGDFNGAQGISAAILALPTHPRSLKGVADGLGGLTEVQTWPGKISGASGALAKFTAPRSITFTGTDITQGSNATGSTFNLSAHGLAANEPVTFITTGFLPNPLEASPLGPVVVRYYIINVTTNTFQVSAAANGTPIYLNDLGTGTHTLISGLPFNFTEDDLYRNINISSAGNAVNIGSFLITEVLDRSSVILTRLDGQVFVDESTIVYDFVSGAKIMVMPGVYDPFIIPASKNDVEITAWGSGSDTIIKGLDGSTPVSPILRIDGSRCLVQGFRFSGGVPVTGVAIQVNGSYNTFIGNRFETANRYAFAERAIGNRVFDSAEAEGRTAFTVSVAPSRADYTGGNEASIQAALDAISRDNHLATVYLGKGTWTFRQPVTVPANVQLFGTGYETRLVGDGTFPAFQLDSGGGQSFVGVNIQNFTYSLAGPADKVYVVQSWQSDAVVDPTVVGEIRFFGETKLYGDVTIDGTLLVSDSITVGDEGILGTTASIGTLFDTPATINFGTAASDDSLYNIATGSTASGATKTVNIGTNGLVGSTTNIQIGSNNSGTTTLQNYTVVNDRLLVNDDLMVGTLFSVDGPTGDTFIGGSVSILATSSSTTPALTARGRILVGDQILNTGLSNALDFSVSTGTKAFRTINVVDTAAQFKLLRVNSSIGASFDLQQWNETLTSNITFWDVVADSGRLCVRDRLQGIKNRLFIDESGRVLIGSTTSTTIAAAASEIDPNFMLAVKGNVNVEQTLWVGNGRISTSAVSASLFNDVSSLTVGSSSLTTTYNLAIGTTASGFTKTVNIATNGGLNSVTNVNIGSSESGTTRLLNATSMDKSLSVADDLAVGTKFLVDAPTGNATAAALLVTSGSITTTATSAVLFASPQSISFGASTQNSLMNVAHGATVSGSTKTVNIGTNGVSGSTTRINIGAFGSINLQSAVSAFGALKVNGSFNVADKFTVDNATGNTVVTGSLAANGGITTTLSSIDLFPNVLSLTLENAVTSDSFLSLAGGATAAGATKEVRLGTGGASGSTTNIVIGSKSSTTSVLVEGDQDVAGAIDVTGSTILRSDVSISGVLSLDSGTLVSSQASAYIFSTVSNIYIADATTGSSRIDIATGTTASGATKVVNIGTNGANSSTTNIVIGSLNSGTTTLQNYTLVNDSFKVSTDFTVGTNRLVVQGSTGNTTIAGTVAVNSGIITTTAVSSSVFSSSTAITIAGTATSSGVYNFATGPTAASSTKTINIGTNGVFGSTTDINIGSANTTAGTTTVNNSLVVRGDFTVQGTTATVNATTLDVKDTNITLNKGGTNITAEGSGLTIEGTGASSLSRLMYDSTLASRFKLGPNGSESEVLTANAAQTITGSKTFSAPQTVSLNSSSPALTVTQSGLGHAILVEDQSPDSSPFVVGTNGKVGIGTLTLTSELNVNGKATLGDQILNTNVSNVVNSSSTNGVDAYRSLNIVDSVGVLKIANTTTSSAAALELQTWNSTITTNTGYWDVYTEAGCLAIRDKKQLTNRLTITPSGSTYIGGSWSNGEDAKNYLATYTGHDLIVEGSSWFNGAINANLINGATVESGLLNSLRKLSAGTSVATISPTDYVLTPPSTDPILRIQSGTMLGGISNGANGLIYILINETASDVQILHESSLPATAARFNTPDGGRWLLKPKASVLVHYNAAISRWLVTGYTSPPNTFVHRAVSANYTLIPSDYFVSGTGSTGITLTLPTAVGVSGTVYYLKSRLTGSALLRIATTSSQTIDDVTSLTLARNEVVGVVSNGSNWEMF